jgi:hypothetical protein
MAILIRREKLAEPLDPLWMPEELPTAWNGAHVAVRLTEAFVTVLKMPGGRKGYRSLWPAYMYEFDDLVAQAEQGELERTMNTQNRVKVAPSTQEITRMETATYWPMQHLHAQHPQLCEAVNMIALAHALGFDAGWVARKRGRYAGTWRQRHDRGCQIIAAGLVGNKVAVF